MKKQLILLTLCTGLLAFNTNATRLPATHHASLTKTIFDEGTKAKLVLGGKTYDVITYNLNFTALDKTKGTDVPLQTYPGLNVFNGITLSIRSAKIDQELLDWLTSTDGAPKDGQIIITDVETGKTLKTLNLSGLRPSTYNDNYYSNVTSYGQGNTSFGLRFAKVSIKL